MELSEPKLISPLLDNFTMGGPFSDRHGVRCCPAMENNSDKRYIVKVISVPASQVQLEALLLTGAYSSNEEALNYFKEVSEGIVHETEILKKLSALEGFLPYEGSQVVPMEDGTGFDVYLLSPYRKSLERHFRKYPMTHLAAVNLGLDMCASLAVCRQAGYLYTNLKPDNIFISDDQEYRIGDLGFAKLDGLAYASLPDRSRSAFTAPEVSDALSSLNPTIDIYAAGMILYQAYNGGKLPSLGQVSADEPLDPPMYADYEMAEIIMKAIDPNPENRWQDPVAMGQGLVAYMQRNEVNNTYIVPPVVLTDEDVAAVLETQDVSQEEISEPMADQVVIAECFPEEEIPEVSAAEEDLEEDIDFEELPEDDFLNLSFLNDLDIDDTTPGDHAVEGVTYGELSDDVSGILEQADDLIAHETPEGVVQPDPIDVPVPELVITTSDPEEEEETSFENDATVVVPVATETVYEEDNEEEDYPVVDKKIGKKIITVLLLILLIAGICLCGYTLYKEYYLQPVTELRLVGSEDDLQVYVVSDVDETRLTVVCTDTHGTSQTAPVKGGVAVFNGLNPNTLYTVKVEVSGFGKLIGDLTDNYTTPVQTNIAAFQAVTGSEAGSVILSFTMEGQDADTWNVTYQAEGEPQVTETFTGHNVTIQGLTVGKTYTFTLGSNKDLYIVGNNTLSYTAIDPVMAQNLSIVGCANDTLTASWEVPDGSSISQWSVRCYSDNGYDQTIVTDQTTVTFTGIVCVDAHTVEVTALGMSEAARCYMTTNAVTITGITATQTAATKLELVWNVGETQPAGNWLIMYSVDGSAKQGILRSDINAVTVSPIVPGATYQFTIQQEDSSTVFGGSAAFATADSQEFSGYLVSASTMQISMCKAPAASGWTYEDLENEDYRIKFAPGELAGFVLMMTQKYNTSDDMITTTYVIRDAEGIPVSWDSNERTWTDMWRENYCHLTVPALPAEPGNYTIEIYFNGLSVCDSSFTITE